MWHMHEIGWGWWLLMSIGTIAFVALIVVGVLALTRPDDDGRHVRPAQRPEEDAPPLGQEPPRQAATSPLSTLKQRLASGEISVEDYEQRRRILEGRGRSTGDEPRSREAA